AGKVRQRGNWFVVDVRAWFNLPDVIKAAFFSTLHFIKRIAQTTRSLEIKWRAGIYELFASWNLFIVNV
ncbi:hypothetical protein NE645_18100, partial [Roseburia hominis]|nr:hypothetical protein [Roseburia hominis]